jgi:phage terminase large subunit
MDENCQPWSGALHRFSFQLADNPNLSPDYVADVSAEFTGLWYRRLIKGEWCLAEGVVYDMFDDVRHILRGPLPRLVRLPGVGVDYGIANPFAALMLGIQPADRQLGTPARLVLAREFRHDSKKAFAQKTDAELSRDLRTWIGDDEPEWIAVDPSAASFKVQLWRDGLSNVMDAKNSVLDGIRLVSSLLATNQLVVHESCAGFLEEIPSYSWDPKAAKQGEDKPVKADDHSLDAGRYVVASTETLWRPYVPASYAA